MLIVLLLRLAPYFETMDPVMVDPVMVVLVEQVYNAPSILLDPEIARFVPRLKINPLTILPLIVSPAFE